MFKHFKVGGAAAGANSGSNATGGQIANAPPGAAGSEAKSGVKTIKCSICEKFRPLDMFSNRQIINYKGGNEYAKAKSKASCMDCTSGCVTHLTCCRCGLKKPLDKFMKTQRRRPDAARCKRCVQLDLDTARGTDYDEDAYEHDDETSEDSDEDVDAPPKEKPIATTAANKTTNAPPTATATDPLVSFFDKLEIKDKVKSSTGTSSKPTTTTTTTTKPVPTASDSGRKSTATTTTTTPLIPGLATGTTRGCPTPSTSVWNNVPAAVRSGPRNAYSKAVLSNLPASSRGVSGTSAPMVTKPTPTIGTTSNRGGTSTTTVASPTGNSSTGSTRKGGWERKGAAREPEVAVKTNQWGETSLAKSNGWSAYGGQQPLVKKKKSRSRGMRIGDDDDDDDEE